MGLRSRKSATAGKKVQKNSSLSRTFGHPGAIHFADAVVDQRWGDAEAAFASASLVDQGHMISVVSNTVDSPDTLNDWIHQDLGSGVAELARGATAIVEAWDVRTGAPIDSVDSSIIDTFHETLETAEEFLFTAAEKMPESSIPWQHLLTSGRGLQTNRLELDERYVRHIELGELLGGHMSFQQLITRKWAGSHDEMWEHAEWILKTAPAGAPHLVLVAIALIEHHIKADVKYESIRQLPSLIGKSEILAAAAHRSYADPAFDDTTPEGAVALSAWFSLHYVMGNWELAAELAPRIGDRFAKFPMMYFQDASWEEIREFLNRRLVAIA